MYKKEKLHVKVFILKNTVNYDPINKFYEN